MADTRYENWSERCKQRSPNRTHGFTTTPKRHQVYLAWKNMKLRCKPSNPLYGGRGITVCERWRDSFENFLADMGFPPSPAHSLDRKENDGNYCPENCRWGTARTQANNRRSNVVLELHGRKQTMAQWASEAGIKTATLWRRLRVAGLSLENALAPPV